VIAWLVLILLLITSPSWATTRYYDNAVTMVADCTTGNYSITNRDCSGTDGNAYRTTAAVISPTVAGDTIYVRDGTVTQQWDFQVPNKSGSATGGYITLAGFPGERPIFTGAGGDYGAVKVRGNRGYFIFKNFDVDLLVSGNDSGVEGWAVRDGNHDMIFDDVHIMNQRMNGLYLDSVVRITIKNSKFSNARLRAGTTTGFFYGIYAHDGSDLLIENCEVYDNTGGGIHVYPGPWNNVTIRNNKIYNNTTSTSSSVGGVIFFVDSSGGNITNAELYGNEIYGNGVGGIGGGGGAIRIGRSSTTTFTVNGVKVHNNVGYDNQASAGKTAYGLNISTGISNTDVKNNIFLANESGQILDGGTGTVTATNKTTGAITDCLTSTTDFRLKQGVNTCVDAGTTVTTRPSPVGSAPDIGVYERGSVTSAIVASTFIEVTVSVMTPGVMPTSGLSAFTITNGTSTGTPVVGSAVVKAGANNIIQLTVSGFTGSGSCTVSYGAGNMTDSLFIGGTTNGVAQGVNSATNLAVSGTCNNSAGGTAPTSNLTIHYKLNEGAGTNAADEETVGGGNQPGTLSGSPTWTTPVVEGAGLAFTANADQRISVPYGNAVDPRATSFTFCLWVKPNTGITNKIVMGPSHGTNQRMYLGINPSGFWGIGVASSSFSSGNSEFASSNTLTRVCLINNSATDIATLVVNKVMGTSAAAVKSSASITALASDFKIGCGFSDTSICGGYTIDEVKVWTKALSQTEINEDYDSYVVAGGSVACYKQQNHRWQRVSTDPSMAAENIGAAGATVDIVENGAVALVIQVDCTGSAGSALALRAYYSTDGSTFSIQIPNTFGSDNIAFWGDSTDPQLNRFTATCCLSGALTANDGVTVLSSVVSPTITLSQNHSYTVRLIIRVGAIAGQSRYIRLYQDNGVALSGGYTTTPRLNVIPMRANSGP
jgi:parallel beta-helix repeat protein